jgi:predicted nucleic acid-binding Zn ribbon protein
MKRINEVINNALVKYNLKNKIKEIEIISKWDKIVGELISKHTAPRGIYYKKFIIDVDSPIWANELSLIKDKLIEKINSEIGSNVVKDIKFKLK